MPASPKAELTFEYVRRGDEYTGHATLTDSQVAADSAVLSAVARAVWVRFVVNTIREHADVQRVSLRVSTESQAPAQYQFDQQTLARIRDESWSADDFIL